MIGGQFFDLNGFSMNSNFKLLANNLAQSQTVMCRGDINCFTNANGFSAIDHDQDIHSSFCCPNYGSVGWWYAQCYHYNAHRTDDGSYNTYQNFAANTQTWTWFMR